MDARPCPPVYDDESWQAASAFRVALCRSAQDREYVVYAKVGSEDRRLHVAGWNPVVGHGPPLNLHRLRP